jgi:hypothetical protein
MICHRRRHGRKDEHSNHIVQRNNTKVCFLVSENGKNKIVGGGSDVGNRDRGSTPAAYGVSVRSPYLTFPWSPFVFVLPLQIPQQLFRMWNAGQNMR